MKHSDSKVGLAQTSLVPKLACSFQSADAREEMEEAFRRGEGAIILRMEVVRCLEKTGDILG